ncbi:MAG: response regulator [Selenomonas ruminantium]|jgi:two-component system alkaline phosphatase synthesis response regulator PhoP|nr:response regulator [Selenomonas ruminantium]
MKVLAVDDEQSIRELLAFQLQQQGYEVLLAADGREALAKAAGTDLILLDLMLPELDGLEVCRRLKAEKETARIPIIMLTAKAEEIDKVLGLELGADDYVVKPFSVRELLARVKAVLRRANQEEAQEQTLTIDGMRQVDVPAHFESHE